MQFLQIGENYINPELNLEVRYVSFINTVYPPTTNGYVECITFDEHERCS